MKSREEREEEEKKARGLQKTASSRGDGREYLLGPRERGRIVEGREGRRRRGDRESRLFWRGAGEIGENN